MRYPPEQKEGTRRKIVDTASRAFRANGVEGASVSDIMAEAGLTVGGFYRHFDSKDELFREALDKAMGETLALMQQRRSRAAGPESTGHRWADRAAAVYLSPEHRERRASGCPLPELTTEVGRRDEETREHYEKMLKEIVHEVSLRLAPAPGPESEQDSTEPKPGSASTQAWGYISTLVGSLLLSRGVADPELADLILESGRQAAQASVSVDKPLK